MSRAWRRLDHQFGGVRRGDAGRYPCGRSEMLKHVKRVHGAVVGAVLLLPVVAFAQATDPFTTAVTDATTKITTYAGALVGVAAASVVLLIGVKYVKKIRGAA